MNDFYKLFDKDYYAFSSISILIAITTLIFGFYNKNPMEKVGLVTLNGKIEKFNYKPNSNQRYTYLIKMQNLENDLQIPANYLSIFDKHTFELSALKPQNINFFILKTDEKKLNKKSQISVFGIYSKSKVILDLNEVIQINKKSNKRNVIISFIFFIFGILYFYIRKRILAKRKKHYR